MLEHRTQVVKVGLLVQIKLSAVTGEIKEMNKIKIHNKLPFIIGFITSPIGFVMGYGVMESISPDGGFMNIALPSAMALMQFLWCFTLAIEDNKNIQS